MAEYLIAHIGHTAKWCEHITWWNPDSKGYTYCIDKAGRYSEDEARNICQWGSCIAVPVASVEPLARSTPYFRAPGGRLANLYDGGQLRPVENEAQAWRHLMNARLLCSKIIVKPTPMPPSKARAIYLDAAHQPATPTQQAAGEPVEIVAAGWLEAPYGEFRRNPVFRVSAPLTVGWSIPLYASAFANTHPAQGVPDIDDLAQFIRQIDGNHSMGAGALAERICEWLTAAQAKGGER